MTRPTNASGRSAFVVRALALLCACSLSIGSHYASYILGPLKSKITREMGTDNTEFSLLISALSLNSTWTPLVGGIMASRLGTTLTSILATGVIFLGQALLLLGDISENVRLMAFGLFVFGLGVSPLAVVQETIIVRFFQSHGLGVSLALGLVAGKGASFISARSSYPLSQKFGPHAPFIASTALAAFSVLINLIYVSASKWLVRNSDTELEAAEIEEEASRRASHNLSEAQALERVAEKRKVHFRDITKLGDVFWVYIGLNILCGAIWSPFTHLAANIIERRYGLTELEASNSASYLLAGSVILYPICGYITDHFKNRPIVLQLFLLSAVLTACCYAWLALPPSWTETPMPGIAAFGIGQGFSPLLLVMIVPQIVPFKYVSTTLGAHKALEQTGSTISQTLAGLSLDLKSRTAKKPMQYLLNAFLAINLLEILVLVGLVKLVRRRSRAAAETQNRRSSASRKEQSHGRGNVQQGPARPSQAPRASTSSEESTEATPLLGEPERARSPRLEGFETPPIHQYLILPDQDEDPEAPTPTDGPPAAVIVTSKSEIRRGEISAAASAALVVFAWVLFMVTAWLRLRSKQDRGGAAGGSGSS
ncbi:MFS general substrate transporter [Gloeophyllum trabeum ATCC 11539]|uniref:Lysosomal dipeptide transporter MFSD1 n=1 Tax=Gloeophyllum trabeum (strain ATCC 11539 / FP-39264 / Madison 617) TaxID=670483 RepID=S7QMT7_GLOTA|nr:MFS general substrate transporter [Gloeophyllum trabeum ATCC 11539]EPQ60798.1 MFS general substrate transporter [Gloeophyllum trabeum ATCC 11539]